MEATLERHGAPMESASWPSSARCVELIVCALVLLGLVMAYSASAPFVSRTGELADTFGPFLIHLAKLVVGLVLFVAARRIPLEWLQRHHNGLLLFCLLLMTLVFAPWIGVERNGAERWIGVGALRFQPIELTKIAVVIAVAARLHAMRDAVTRMGPCVVLLFITLVPVSLLLCKQPDFGSTVLLAGLVFLLMIFAGARPVHYIPATLAGFGSLVGCAYLFMPHVLDRFSKHAAPEPGEQAYQSLVALGSGGLSGLTYGVGDGMAKLGYLPMIKSDFVFALVGEEFGFLGTTLVVFLYLMFTVMASGIVLAQRDRFRFLLAAGLTLGLSIQVLVNLVVVTAVTPTKGIALPFLSAGGSSLAMSLFAVGLLVNMANDVDRNEDRTHVGDDECPIPETTHG